MPINRKVVFISQAKTILGFNSFPISNQKVTWKDSEQAGQLRRRFPGRGRIRSCLSQEGQETSTLTTLGTTLNTVEQDEHRNAHGRSSTPTRRIFGQFGQLTFSSIQLSRVGL